MNRRIPVENLRPIDGALFFNMNLKKKNICSQFFENVASEEIGGKLWWAAHKIQFVEMISLDKKPTLYNLLIAQPI